jgi:hypothetical protein
VIFVLLLVGWATRGLALFFPVPDCSKADKRSCQCSVVENMWSYADVLHNCLMERVLGLCAHARRHPSPFHDALHMSLSMVARCVLVCPLGRGSFARNHVSHSRIMRSSSSPHSHTHNMSAFRMYMFCSASVWLRIGDAFPFSVLKSRRCVDKGLYAACASSSVCILLN